jgi:hypothetical protein
MVDPKRGDDLTALVIYSGSDSNSVVNFSHGMRNGVWGFQKVRAAASQDFDAISPGDLVIFATGFKHPKGSSPRKPSEEYLRGAAEELVLGQVTKSLFQANSLEWPDEVAVGQVLYPFRLIFHVAAKFQRVDYRRLNPSVVEGFRLSALRQGEPTFIQSNEIWQT